MSRVLVNAGNLTGAGARVVGGNLLPALFKAMPDATFFITLPDQEPYSSLFATNPSVMFVKRRSGIVNDFDRLRELFWGIARTARRLRPDVCLSLGDLSPMGLPCPNVTLLHQSLLVYSNQELAGLGGWSPLKRFYLTRYFSVTAPYHHFVVQTPVMAERLRRLYHVKPDRIAIIPQPVPQTIIDQMRQSDLLPAIAACPKPIRLLFLSAYYPHKNHAILLPVAEKLRHQNLADQVHIFTTIDVNNPDSRCILEQFGQNGDIITNLGHLPGESVASALRASSALFLPTLVESYGIIYLESMQLGRPILTSDRDFAHWMCQDAALYFEPLSPESIAEAIQALPLFLEKLERNRMSFAAHLETFPQSWNDSARQLAEVLRKAMN